MQNVATGPRKIFLKLGLDILKKTIILWVWESQIDPVLGYVSCRRHRPPSFLDPRRYGRWGPFLSPYPKKTSSGIFLSGHPELDSGSSTRVVIKLSVIPEGCNRGSPPLYRCHPTKDRHPEVFLLRISTALFAPILRFWYNEYTI